MGKDIHMKSTLVISHRGEVNKAPALEEYISIKSPWVNYQRFLFGTRKRCILKCLDNTILMKYLLTFKKDF